MYFDDGQGQRFEMSLVAYQFPSNDEDNWLIAATQVQSREGSYSTSDPSLQTWEVAELAMWLENVALDVEQSLEQEFVEPNLRFHHAGTRDDEVTIRVTLGYESRPPWADLRDEFELEMTVSHVQCSEAGASLREELRRFPARGA